MGLLVRRAALLTVFFLSQLVLGWRVILLKCSEEAEPTRAAIYRGGSILRPFFVWMTGLSPWRKFVGGMSFLFALRFFRVPLPRVCLFIGWPFSVYSKTFFRWGMELQKRGALKTIWYAVKITCLPFVASVSLRKQNGTVISIACHGTVISIAPLRKWGSSLENLQITHPKNCFWASWKDDPINKPTASRYTKTTCQVCGWKSMTIRDFRLRRPRHSSITIPKSTIPRKLIWGNTNKRSIPEGNFLLAWVYLLIIVYIYNENYCQNENIEIPTIVG